MSVFPAQPTTAPVPRTTPVPPDDTHSATPTNRRSGPTTRPNDDTTLAVPQRPELQPSKTNAASRPHDGRSHGWSSSRSGQWKARPTPVRTAW